MIKVQIFNPAEFPDVPSGSAVEIILQLGVETFVRIDSITLETDTEAQRYSPETVCNS